MFQFVVDRLHTFHILRTRQTFLTNKRVFEVHPIDGVDTNGVADTQLAHKALCLLGSLLFRSTLRTNMLLLRRS